MSVTVADLRVRFGADTKDLEAGVQRAEGRVEGFGSRIKGSLGNIAEFAGGQLLAAGIQKIASSFVGLAESSISASIELNKGLANVASLGLAADRVNELKSSVQSMSIEMGKTTTDLTDGLYQVVSAFGDTADTAKILEINAKAATAGVATTLDAINLTSAVTKGYGDTSAKAVQQVSDLALQTVTLGQTTFPELASSIGKVVPLSKNLGVSQQELFAVMATGTGVTGNASEVATQYRGILQALMSPTDTMSKLTSAMGFKSGEAMLKQLGLSKTIQIMVSAAQRSGLPLQEFIGSIEGQTLALALAGPQAKKYEDNLKAMSSATGKTDEAFKAQTQGINKLGFKLQQAKQWWQVFQQNAGDAIGNVVLALSPAFEPVITSWGQKLNDFIPVVNDWAAKISAAFEASGGGLKGTIAALATAGGATVSVDLKTQVQTIQWGDWIGKLDWSHFVFQLKWSDFLGILNWETKVLALKWGDFVVVFDWNKYVAVLNWDGYVVRLSWPDIVAEFNGWSDYIEHLTWNDFVFGILKWSDYVSSLKWLDYVGELPWSSFVPRLIWSDVTGKIIWNNFIGFVDWKALIGILKWGDFVGIIDWGKFAITLKWSDFVFRLDWTTIAGYLRWSEFIDKLTWTTFLKPVEWALRIDKLLWNNYIQPIAWSTFVASLDFASRVPALEWNLFVSALKWEAYIVKLTWDNYITKLTWADIKKFDWPNFIEKLSWAPYILPINWPGLIVKLAWSEFVDHVNWSNFIEKFTWSNIVNLKWSDYIEKLSWSPYILPITWPSLIVKLTWSEFVDRINWTGFVSKLTWKDFVESSLKWTDYLEKLMWLTVITPVSLPTYVFKLAWADFITGIDFTAWVPKFPGWAAIFQSLGIGASSTPATPTQAQQSAQNVMVTGDLWDPNHHASGTSFAPGGWSWVGEKGPELLNIPSGAQILSNQNSMKLIGHMADGNTALPAGLSAGQSAGFQKFVSAMEQGGDKAGKKIQKAMEAAARKQSEELRGALQSVPGLFSASPVTQKQMDMAKLGIPQNFADDYLRHLTDEVLHGVDWKETDIKDAAARAGIDPTLPAKAILELFTDKWNDSSLFADKKNLDLINMDAVKAQVAQQAASKAGQQNIFELFGIKPDAAVTQATQLGGNVGVGLQKGITDSLSVKKDDKTGGVDLGAGIADALTAQLSSSDAFATAGPTILQKIVDSWSGLTNQVDIAGKLASAMAINLSTEDAIKALQDIGGKIFKIIFQGYDTAASGADYVSPVQSGINNDKKKKDDTIDKNASGTNYWRGGLTWVGERGKELLNLPQGSQIFSNQQSLAMVGAGGGGDTYNVTVQATVDSKISMHELARQVATELKRMAK